MLLYHGSSVGGLTQLKPFLSEHQKPYVYLSSNPVVALLYAVKPVPKPFSFYPYGFDKNMVVYSEYYEDCFTDIYKGKKGYLYECESIEHPENPTAIHCAYTCEIPIKVCNCTEIKDVYDKFMEYKENGLFDIKPFCAVPEKELLFAYNDIKAIVEQYQLRSHINNPMSKFIISHFPEIWFE